MTDQERKAMQMALNALEFNLPVIEDFGSKEQLTDCHRAIMALYKTLTQPEQTVANKSDCGHKTYEPLCQMCRLTKQPEQEPVAWMVLTQDDKKLMLYGEEKPPIFNTSVKLIHLYTAPPSKPWVSLTDEDFDNIYKRYDTYDSFARAIEAKLKEKNT